MSLISPHPVLVLELRSRLYSNKEPLSPYDQPLTEDPRPPRLSWHPGVHRT